MQIHNYMLGIKVSEEREGEVTTLMPQAGSLIILHGMICLCMQYYRIHITGSELVNDASSAIIPLIASIMSMGVFLLLLIVVVLIIYMNKQIVKHYA